MRELGNDWSFRVWMKSCDAVCLIAAFRIDRLDGPKDYCLDFLLNPHKLIISAILAVLVASRLAWLSQWR